jgi:putative endonuclease
MTNKSNTVLYTGVTSDLRKRVHQHREKLTGGFTARYNCTKLVYYEVLEDMYAAISREKQIKAGSRSRKIELIEAMNAEWKDLYETLG